jgi:multiple sugar transport system ATP-binding protein
MAEVQLREVTKSFQSLEVVHAIDLAIADGEFVVLVGPSGCGKSTTLRMIAGLEKLSSGEIFIGERRVNDVPARDRDIAMVFQNYALYPHMSVAENMAYALKLRKMPDGQIKTRVDDAAEMLDLVPLMQRKPQALSGGQRQRVAMGRAMVRHPKVFLFDEPLSNLDAKLRVRMRAEIKRLHQAVRTTTVYVTHDQVEAMTLADRVVVMNQGRIEQVGAPQDLYHAPASKFVAGFIGSPAMNFLPCRLDVRGARLAAVLSDGTALPVPANRTACYRSHLGRDLELGLRPEHLTEPRNRDGEAPIAAQVEVVEPMGMETFLYLRIAGNEAVARIEPVGSAPRPGETLNLAAQMNQMHLLDPRTGAIL